MNQPELGKTVFALRQQKGLTQGQLAESCNLSLRTIQRIESFEVAPRSYTIRVLLNYLEYDLYSSDNSHSAAAHSKGFFPNDWFYLLIKNFKELFNLKTNTMKKISALTVIVTFFASALLFSNSDLQAQKIEGWFLAGSKPDSYEIGLDKKIYKSGESSAFLVSKEKKIDGFGTLMQSCEANEYLGKRIQMTAYIKSEDVLSWAGMWLRVDEKETKKLLSFDNMRDRPIKGSNDWTKCEIILDVPEESGTLNFGVLLRGTGKVWFDNISFKVVEKEETEPTQNNTLNKKPMNLDFGS